MLKKSLFFLFSLLIGISLSAQETGHSSSDDSEYEKDPNEFMKIRNLKKINSDRRDFSPQYYQNGIVYVTSATKSAKKDKKTGDNYYDLFYAEFNESGMPMSPQKFGFHINSKVHEGPTSFSRDMKTIYYTSNSATKGYKKSSQSKAQHTLKIFEAKRGTHDWQDVKELSFNSESYYCLHPSLSPDGRKLYFASDMPGGYGGSDLYVVEKMGAGWGTPENLGPRINTRENDAFPYVHESGKLIFSSKGHLSKGGYDIYVADISRGLKGAEVLNLGAPINTVKDDFGLVMNKDGNQGFFSSNRNSGSGADDIYYLDAPLGLRQARAVKEKDISIYVVDAYSRKGIKNAKVRVLEQSADGFLEGDEVYDIEMVPSPNAEGELVFKLKRKDALDMNSNLVKRTTPEGETLYSFQDGKRYIILASKDGYQSADKMYVANSVGNKRVEIALSPQACVNVRGDVVSLDSGSPLSGVDLIVTNKSNGKTQNVTAGGDGKFTVCVPSECDYEIRASKNGYLTSASSVSTIGRKPGAGVSTNIGMARENVSVTSTTTAVNTGTTALTSGSINTGDVIELQNIYYDFGKSTIRSGAARDLDALVVLMKKYPSMQIELISHTDSRGSSQFNQNLSLSRSESARTYIINRGISPSRIKAFGYGENELRNDCVDGRDCSEEEHEYNRRTEVKITRIGEDVQVKYRVRKP